MSSISIRGAKHTDSMLNLGSFIVLELIKKIRGKDHMVVDLWKPWYLKLNPLDMPNPNTPRTATALFNLMMQLDATTVKFNFAHPQHLGCKMTITFDDVNIDYNE